MCSIRANSIIDRSPNCIVGGGGTKRPTHTTTKDTPSHKEAGCVIVAASALLELARWSQQRKESDSGGEPCPKARKTEFPPIPRANSSAHCPDGPVARIAHPKPPTIASEVESAGESTTERGATRGGGQ